MNAGLMYAGLPTMLSYHLEIVVHHLLICLCAGAWLTAYELMHDGLPATLFCASPAGVLVAY